MRVLIAPDKFKDALDAPAVAAALRAGVLDARPDAHVECCPMADGGEGTGPILAAACGAEARTATVLDPLGRPRPARWWLDRRPDGPCEAIIEMAEASGLALLKSDERNPLNTTSFGTGQLIAEAARSGATRIALCVGGSATVDGGAGCLQALGVQFVDVAGEPVPTPIRGGDLQRIADCTLPESEPVAVVIACDVDNPLLGRNGAARVFGPQKGASPLAVEQLERGLAHWAAVLQRCTGRDVRRLARGGAAGGLPAGLHGVFGARLVQGAVAVAHAVGLPDRLPGCDLCVTGEGRIDAQTGHGKVVAAVARWAETCNVPAVAFTGAAVPRRGQTLAELAEKLGLRDIIVITRPGTPLPAALAATRANLRAAAARYAASLQGENRASGSL